MQSQAILSPGGKAHGATEEPADSLEGDLVRAVRRGSLAVEYQPRVCLQTRKIMGAEALARWPHRRRGMVSPGVFIPVAERSDLIVELGYWVLARACSEVARWPGRPVVSVNVSARQLADGLLLRQVKRALAETALPPEQLELELTESMLVDAGVETLLTLSAVRDLGIGIALDDFGTGYASLGALKRLPLTVMKLDRSLVRGVPRFLEDTGIAKAVVATAHTLGLEVVAEGIEGEEQCAFLAELGCREGQSFFLGRPTTSARLQELLVAQGGDA